MSSVDGQAAIRRHAAVFCGYLSLRNTMPIHFCLARRMLCALALFLSLLGSTFAQEPAAAPTLDQRMADVETKVGDAALAGHNAWMLTSTALVLFMTAP